MTPHVVRGFSVLELVIATIIFLIIMGVTMTLFFGSNREFDDLRASLDANEKVLKAFDRLSRDVAQCSIIEAPAAIAPENAPPPFRHESPRESTGRLELTLERPSINGSANGLDSIQERVTYCLDRPVRLGIDPKGREVVTFSLIKTVESHGDEHPTTSSVLDGVSELIFFRTAGLDAQGEPSGTGASVVHAILRVANTRVRSDRRLAPGYQAEFSSCFAIRGKDVASRRTPPKEVRR